MKKQKVPTSNAEEISTVVKGNKETMSVEDNYQRCNELDGSFIGHDKIQLNGNIHIQQMEVCNVTNSDSERAPCSPSFGLDDEHFPTLPSENEVQEDDNVACALNDEVFLSFDAWLTQTKNDSKSSNNIFGLENLVKDNTLSEIPNNATFRLTDDEWM